MNIGQLKGFNYQPSYGSSGFELWMNFDAETVELELARGKAYFPQMQAIRWWLSWDAWKRDSQRFAANFETALALAAQHDLIVMPVLFNRWHDSVLDYGGIYIDHFLPDANYLQNFAPAPGEKIFDPYLDSIVGAHADDARIFAWDLCNEPFFYHQTEAMAEIIRAETAWLQRLYDGCKQRGARAPITVGVMGGRGADDLKQVENFADFFSIHPYFTGDSPPCNKEWYEGILDSHVAFAKQSGKALLATETCWGHLDDSKRVELIRYTLGELKKRGIGWLCYSLHHSRVADLHRAEFGPTSEPGNLSFIDHDGSLRAGHDVWNEFV